MQDTNQTETKVEQSAQSPVIYPRRKTLLLSALLAPGAGLAASLTAVVVMGILRLTAGIPTPVELFGDFVLKHINVNLFLRLLLTFGANAKTEPLGLALLGMIALGTVLALLYAALVRLDLPISGTRPPRREWLIGLAFGLVMTLFAVALFWNEIGQNFFGLTRGTSMFVTALGLLADFVAYGVVLCLAYRFLLPKQAVVGVPATAQARRLLLSRAGIAAWSVAAAGGTVGLVSGFLGNYASYDGNKTPSHKSTAGKDFTPLITPNSEHYVVTQNPIDPTPNIDLWRLEVAGLLHSTGSLTYAEVQNLPSTSRAITLECIANGPGGHLMATAIWQGVTLRTLIDHYGGSQTSATHVAFYSVDGYNVSLPLKEVLEADALLAWRMNGVELPLKHGYPMRVLIPSRYGEENPKWLTRVELTDHFIGGLYSDQGWSNLPLHTTSRIDSPTAANTLAVGQSTAVSGIAFAGNRGIQKVEVSTDGGTTWNQATLQPALSPDAWVAWDWQWTPPAAGKYMLAVRATDGTGEVQTGKNQGTVPNGATGYHKMMVTVS